jgi:iron(II)-dependent oxidoreductase
VTLSATPFVGIPSNPGRFSLLATRDCVSDLLHRVSDSRQRSDSLFRLVREDSLYERPIPERHRLIFYIGHLEAFDWNLLREPLGLRSFHPEFDRLFAFGIDPVGGGLPTDQPQDWPAHQRIRDYVERTRALLDDKLTGEAADSEIPGRDGHPFSTLLNVAIEHRLMHLETLAYMLHHLPLDRKLQASAALDNSSDIPASLRMLPVSEGDVTLGLARGSNEFGWDNEYESHIVHVPPFRIDRYQITNQQYLEFVNAPGYETREFWDNEAWDWKSSAGISHPAFWKRSGEQWLYRTMFQEIPLPLDWPVYVSHAEAAAYSRWSGKSLPTEAEWHRAAYGTPDGTDRRYPWGDAVPTAALGNFDFHRWDPAPVHAFPGNKSAFGVEGMLGNGWEWTSTAFAPFAGFQAFPFYRGYSANFFDGKHFVLKGGSSRTAACMLRPTFRNWFQAHYRYVYAGFRCVSR